METKSVRQSVVILRNLDIGRANEIALGARASAAWFVARLLEMHDGRPVYPMEFSPPEIAWFSGESVMSVHAADYEATLRDLYFRAKKAGLEVHRICRCIGSNLTPTLMAVAVGPDFAESITTVIGNLPPY